MYLLMYVLQPLEDVHKQMSYVIKHYDSVF